MFQNREPYLLMVESIQNLPFEGKREWRQEIGMVFQGIALFDSQTVEENVMFPLKMFTNKSQKEMLARVNFVLDRVNLTNSNKISSRTFGRNAKKSCHSTSHCHESEIPFL